MKALTTAQEDRLAQLEKEWEEGVHKAGKAMQEIREQHLYIKWGSFEDYCRKRWNINIRAAEYTIKAYKIRNETRKILRPPERKLLDSASDSAVRELGKFPKRSRSRVLNEVAKKNDGHLTATSIEKVSNKSGPCSEFGDGRSYRGQPMANFYVGDSRPAAVEKPATAVPIRSVAFLAPAFTKECVLAAYDAEVEAHLKDYKSREDMAERVRKVLEAL